MDSTTTVAEIEQAILERVGRVCQKKRTAALRDILLGTTIRRLVLYRGVPEQMIDGYLESLIGDMISRGLLGLRPGPQVAAKGGK